MRLAVPIISAALALSAAGAANADWYSDRKAVPPRGDRIYLCHGYACRIVTPLQLSPGELARIAAPLRAKHGSAAAERRALAKSVAVFEGIAGKRAGTSADLAGMQFGGGRDDQMDCIDEATNTTSLLRVLAAHGLLKHHHVAEPTARGFFLDGRYPHATATVAEKGGTRWAIDSWPDANGRPPLVQQLDDWYRAMRSAPPA